MFQVRNLLENQLYEFWVSATTGSGEGESTLVVGQGPSSRSKALYILIFRVFITFRGHDIYIKDYNSST